MKENIIDTAVKTIVNSKVLQAFWKIIINALPLVILIGITMIIFAAVVRKFLS